MATITYEVPHKFKCRSYQRPLIEALLAQTKRALTIWHRRSGKDTTWLNWTIYAMTQRVGTYIYLFPELKRGRKILWEGKNREGMRFLDHFPPGYITRRREDEMLIEGVNGSTFRIEGVENLDSIVGMNPVGIVLSEYSQMRPQAWDYIRPILLENDGWAGFNFTPRGKNFGYELYQMALHDPDWYTSLLTVDDTTRDAPGENGQPIITPEMIASERRQGMREALVLQEYYCSFEVGSALQFIPPAYVREAYTREAVVWAWSPKVLGIDVGRARDRTVLTLRQGGNLLERLVIHPYQHTDNPSQFIAGVAARICQSHAPHAVFVDGVGIGVGVLDLLHSMGYSAISVLGNAQSPDEAYYNLRAYMWGQMREWLRTDGQLRKGRDDVLAAELQWPQWRWKKDKEWLTPKDELEELASGGDDDDNLTYVSPDEADSLALTFAAPVTGLASTLRGLQPRQAPSEYDLYGVGRLW